MLRPSRSRAVKAVTVIGTVAAGAGRCSAVMTRSARLPNTGGASASACATGSRGGGGRAQPVLPAGHRAGVKQGRQRGAAVDVKR